MAEVETSGAGVVSDVSRAGPSSEALELEADERRRDELRKKNREPPIVFKNFDGAEEFAALTAALAEVELNSEEQQSLDELQQFLVQGEGSWVLGDYFLQFIGRLLTPHATPEVAVVATLRCLCACALREDVSLVLHQDRAQHALANAAHSIDTRPADQQLSLATLMCNLFENISSSEWLMYISEWEHNNQPLSNIKATTKVAVHALLAPELREVGTALLYNIATKERFQMGKSLRDRLPRHAKSKVFDDVCVELCMAVLQVLGTHTQLQEEHTWRCVRALARLAQHCSDVPALVAMVGPDPDAYRGTSARIDEQLDIIKKKIK